MKLSLRAKFLLLAGVVQFLLVALLLANSGRLLDDAIMQNASRIAQEYAVTLNFSLSPYAQQARLDQVKPYLDEMLATPQDSYLRYLYISNARGERIFSVGQPPPQDVISGQELARQAGLQMRNRGLLLHAAAPFLLQRAEIGQMHFAISTEELSQTRRNLLWQGIAIACVIALLSWMLLLLFTRGIGRRLQALHAHAQRLQQGEYGARLSTRGGDEIATLAEVMNRLGGALQERIAVLEESRRQLGKSEARFKTLFELAPAPLTVTSIDGRLQAVNQAWQNCFGYSPAQVLGRTSQDIGFWDSMEERARIWDQLKNEGQVQGIVACARTAQGVVLEVAVWSARTDEGNLVWALLDLSAELQARRALQELNATLELRVAERAAALQTANQELSQTLATLRRTQAELVTSEKMAALGSLVAGVAHEMNTPLGNSLLMASALHDQSQEMESAVQNNVLKRSQLLDFLQNNLHATRTMLQSLQKAANLVASFKQVAVDRSQDARRSFDLRTVLQDTLSMYGPRLQRQNCRLELQLAPDLSLDSYPGSLSQVLDNLLANALLHGLEGRSEGRISVSASAPDAQSVRISVRDDGNGMSASVLQHVFEPFFTTRMGQGGNGLGMHIVYNLVRNVLGGQIVLESSPGQGCCVTLELPRIAPATDTAAQVMPQDSP
ncbi:ATP-binding protein [Massilia sp. W12]|uniref:ATP-binding protein n=1 Tax=Massilia sp. W12 TaxID=3126507 RepID=UPI0030CDEE8C